MTRTVGRREIVDRRAAKVSRAVVVAAAPSVIFAMLSDPAQHAGLDGSGAVRALIDGPERLEQGSVFQIQMKGYQTTNTVVEYERDAVIAWRHRGRHIWRWELRAVPGGTEVIETFDYTAKRGRWVVRLIGIPTRAAAAIDKTLVQLHTRFA